MTIEPVQVIRITADVFEYFTEILKEINKNNASITELHIFEFEHVRYIFNNRIEQFVRMRQLDEISSTNQLIHSQFIGVTDKERGFL